MSKYRMEDGTVVNTDSAARCWSDRTDFDGNNDIHRTTKDQWSGEILYRSRKGRYYIEHYSKLMGVRDYATWISHEEAAAWLCLNDYDIPAELAEAADRVIE